MSAESRVTLKEIAGKLGISRMTVSVALRGKTGVSETTRRRVLEIAEKLGYQPDPEVSNLMSRICSKTPTATKSSLALVTFGPVNEESKLSVTEQKYIEGIASRAKEYGYRIEEFSIEGQANAARISNIIWNRGIEGVILRPLQHSLTGELPRSVQMDFKRFSSVAVSETLKHPDLDRVLHDQYTSMLKVLAELSLLKYKRPGLVLEEELDLRVNGRWTAAYLHHAYRLGTDKLPPPLILKTRNPAMIERWLERYRPDVVIGVSRPVYRFLVKKGLSIPRDLGYVSLDLDGDLPDYPRLSGIDQNSAKVGAAAVDLLVGAIRRGQRGVPASPIRTEIEGSWRAGNSTIIQADA